MGVFLFFKLTLMSITETIKEIKFKKEKKERNKGIETAQTVFFKNTFFLIEKKRQRKQWTLIHRAHRLLSWELWAETFICPCLS